MTAFHFCAVVLKAGLMVKPNRYRYVVRLGWVVNLKLSV